MLAASFSVACTSSCPGLSPSFPVDRAALPSGSFRSVHAGAFCASFSLSSLKHSRPLSSASSLPFCHKHGTFTVLPSSSFVPHPEHSFTGTPFSCGSLNVITSLTSVFWVLPCHSKSSRPNPSPSFAP